MPHGLGVEQLKAPKFHSRQSKYAHMPEVPFRIISLGPGSSGKTLMLQNLILHHYRGVFDFIALFAPTAKLDVGWKPVFDYIEKEMGQKLDDPKFPSVFENFRGEDLDRITGDQFKIIKKLKSNPKGGKLPNILIFADDVADQPEAVRRSNSVGAFVKYRHAQVSTIILTQNGSVCTLLYVLMILPCSAPDLGTLTNSTPLSNPSPHTMDLRRPWTYTRHVSTMSPTRSYTWTS